MKERTFSLNARIKSFDYAIEGLIRFFKTEHNAWIHFLATALVVLLITVMKISGTELLALLLCIGLVFVTEIINTAFEKLCDLVSPQYHPQVKAIKDISAAAVLVAAFISVIIASVIFIPKIF